MLGRSFSTPGYRYGFNGKEKDDEVKGSGAQYDYGFRIYDPRLGKFLSVDPLAKKFAFWSAYAFAGNSPIYAIDLDGLEIRNSYYNYSNDGSRLELKNPDDKEIADYVDKIIADVHNDDKALAEYLDKRVPINVKVGRLSQSGTADHMGHTELKVHNEPDKTLTYQQAYDLDNGEGAFNN